MYTIGQKRKSSSLGCLWLAGIGFAAVLLIIFTADQICAWDIRRRLPQYPGAVRISAEHNFVRVHAMGASETVFFTEDAPETVRSWLQELNLTLLAEGRFQGIAAVDRRAEPDGSGTRIYYTSRCGI
jgi:hypothetical protein